MPHPAFCTYRDALNEQIRKGDAVERSHYPALTSLVQALDPSVLATSEASGNPVGIPDLAFRRGAAPVGFIECKDLGVPLDAVEKTPQLKRYRAGLANLLLTDFLEFRWYVEGEHRGEATLGRRDDRGQVRITDAGAEQVAALLQRFLSLSVEQIGTASDLARRLAHLAQWLKDAAQGSFSSDSKPLEHLRQAFQETLLPDLSPDDFADMYAQTLAYGMFAARYELHRENAGAHFDRAAAWRLLPKTNPFLRRLFSHLTGAELPEEMDWILAQIEDLLNHTDLSQIAADFARGSAVGRGLRTPPSPRPSPPPLPSAARERGPGGEASAFQEDPVVHFYETFLREYDPKKREVRGVYYTPEPVVSYIVRSIDYLLREKFSRPLGLADPDVYILDPACGTGTFLFYVIRTVYETVTRTQGKAAWNSYVREHLLNRLFGFELLMAPYTIAHMKLAIELRDLGYDFSGEERLGIYLTNTLEEARDTVARLAGLEELAEETKAADRVKQQEKIMVVLGNPPYSGHSANKGEWIGSLVRDYYQVDGHPLGERNPKWLQDDYVKFLRFAQWRIDQTGHGIVGMITNHGYLDNPTFRGMRQSLMQTFDQMWILDLHGNSKKKEVAPDGGKDENVFDIQQGVAIGVFARGAERGQGTQLRLANTWGTRELKYACLVESTVADGQWGTVQPVAPQYLFRQQDELMGAEYRSYPLVTDMFAVYASTITTGRNEFLLAFDPATLVRRIEEFRDVSKTDEELRQEYFMGVIDLPKSRAAVRADAGWQTRFRKMLYRPFDLRETFYSADVVTRPRLEVMRHMLHPNLSLLTHRPQSPGDFTYVFCGDMIADQCVAANKTGGGGNSYQFPLYQYPDETSFEASHARRPNLNPAFIADFSQRLGLSFLPDGQGDLGVPSPQNPPPLPGEGGRGVRLGTFGPEDVFYYAYAVFHSPTYRKRYAEFLKIDFPRLPLTSDRELFAALVALGKRLVDLHLLREAGKIGAPPRFEGEGGDVVEKVRYVAAVSPPSPARGGGQGGEAPLARVYLNATQYFEGVEPEVWQFHIGGYQVCEKWLKDRKGRPLTWEDIRHYQRIVLALRETRALMAQIDDTIPGWPLQ